MKRLPMRKIREVLRLAAQGLSTREMASSTGVGRTTLREYCELYTRWEGKLSPVMRQRYAAGETLFVDYAGATIDVVCPETGEVRAAQLFVAALGASNYTYVEASWSQKLPDWIASHTRAFAFFGGVPAQIISDTLKAGVTKACFYDPAINRTYADMAAHYETAVVPARPRKPRDKSKVEAAVLLTERWIVARLRNRRFFGLDELNAAIRELRGQLNGKVTRHLGASRRDLYEKIDKPALKPLPREPYRLELSGQSLRKTKANGDDTGQN